MLQEAFGPLIANGEGGRQNQCWLIDLANCLQTQHCFAGTRSRNNMESPVGQIGVEPIKQTSLVRPPLSPEPDFGRKSVL